MRKILPIKSVSFLLTITLASLFVFAACSSKEEAKSVAVSGLKLNYPQLTLVANQTSNDLMAQVVPTNADNKRVRWSSSDENIRVGQDDGKISVLSNTQPGTRAIITARTDDGGYVKECIVFVVAAKKAAKSVSIKSEASEDNGAFLVEKGGSIQLFAETSPTAANNYKLSWVSSDPNKIEVNKRSGYVVAKGVNDDEVTINLTLTNYDTTVVKATAKVRISPPIAVAKVELSLDALRLPQGKDFDLFAIISPDNADNQNVTWKSSDDAKVSIVANGKKATLKANASASIGDTATVTVTTQDGSKTAECVVTIAAAPVAVTGINFDSVNPTYSLLANPSKVNLPDSRAIYYLTPKIKPDDATNQNLIWTTSDTNVATVIAGKVTAIGAGTATITAKTQDGAFTTTATISVKTPVSVSGLTLTPSQLPFKKTGDTIQLTASVVPTDASNKKVMWVSLEPSVAHVDSSGLVTVKGWGGITQVLAFTQDGAKVQKVEVRAVNNDMVQVPPKDITLGSGIQFPTGTDDSGSATISKSFYMGQTEVTYALWQEVLLWATTRKNNDSTHADYNKRKADDGEIYVFENIGSMGNTGDGSATQPVAGIAWRDAVIWCNAFTEWYNKNEKVATDPDLTLVYHKKSDATTFVRDSSKWTDVNEAQAVTTATGFRLPTDEEWEFAARWQGTTDKGNSISKASNSVTYYFTKGNSASGATASYTDSATNDVAWNMNNSKDTSGNAWTQKVGGKTSNVLKLYDMSGNVREWVFSTDASKPTRGGDFKNNTVELQVSTTKTFNPDSYTLPYEFVGFRIIRSIP